MNNEKTNAANPSSNKEYNLSKSRYCTALQCPKILWLHKYKNELYDETVENESVLITGNQVGDLAMGLFGEFSEVPYTKDYSQMLSDTEAFLAQNKKTICEASFSYQNCFCSVDILRNMSTTPSEKTVELYEVKSSSQSKDYHVDDISYQYYVLTKLGFTVKKACLVHLNSEYVRIGPLDLSQLFTIEDLTETAKANMAEVQNNISAIKHYMTQTAEPSELLGKRCTTPHQCGFWEHCSQELTKDGSSTVWDLYNCRSKEKLYNQGYLTFRNLYDAKVLKGAQLQQVTVEVEDLPPQVDKPAIQEFLSTLTYPLYFLDFETYNPAIPPYDYTSPYQQIVFQYSLHYQEKEGGPIHHTEHLSAPGSDPRRSLAEQLCHDIPLDVCTTAYNMSFEKNVIEGLAELYPDLRDHLMNIHDHIQDLIIPFRKRWYYSKEMKGSCSIKKVLPALFPNDPDLNYHNLEGVHNGGEASSTYLQMQTMSPEQAEQCRNQLLKYCHLDTLAMVKIFQKLSSI